MKKKLIDILLLRKLDRYLLKNYPAVWQTRGHLVLFYSIIIVVISFLIGYAITSIHNLTVPPIKQLFLNNDDSFLLCFGIALFFILYWMFRQYKTHKQAYNFSALLMSLLIYLICIASILLLNTTAYRLGTVYKSKSLMTQEDIDTLKANHFYMYGYAPDRNEDIDEVDFNTGHQRFKRLILSEYKLLKSRYDLDSLLSQLFRPYNMNSLMDMTWSELLYRSAAPKWTELLELSNRYKLSDHSRARDRGKGLSYLNDRSELSYRSYLSNLSNLFYPEGIIDINFKLSKDYKIDWGIMEDHFKNSSFYENKQVIRQCITQFNSKSDSLAHQLSKPIINRYLNDTLPDTYIFEGIAFKHYPYLFYLEDIAWSTKHAQMYIDKNIWSKNAKKLLKIVLFFSLLLACIHYFKTEELAIWGLLLAWGLFVYVLFINTFKEMPLKYLHVIFMLATITLTIFNFYFEKIKSYYYLLLGLTFILLGILFVDVLGLHIAESYFSVKLPGLNFELFRKMDNIDGKYEFGVINDVQLYLIPFLCAFICLFAMWFIHQKPWAK